MPSCTCTRTGKCCFYCCFVLCFGNATNQYNKTVTYQLCSCLMMHCNRDNQTNRLCCYKWNSLDMDLNRIHWTLKINSPCIIYDFCQPQIYFHKIYIIIISIHMNSFITSCDYKNARCYFNTCTGYCNNIWFKKRYCRSFFQYM